MAAKETFMHYLSSKVAISVTRKDRLPYQKREFPPLSEMCIQAITQNFDKYPTLDGIEAHYKEKVYSNLGTNFSIIKMAKHVEYDPYWKKMCDKQWALQKLPTEYRTWREAFFSLFLQEYLENFEDPEADPNMNELLKVMAPATFRLRVDRVRTSFDLCESLSKLYRLQHLRLTLVKKDARSNFNIDNLGMSMEDVNNTANLIGNLKELRILELPCNQIDDSGVKMLIRTLEDHPTLEIINLSHNKISNDGARRMGRTVKKNNKITSLNLANNKIGYEGGRSLSLVLGENLSGLKKINLSLNLIGDKALIIMLEDMKENKSLLELDLSANLLTDESIPHIITFISNNKTLTHFNLGCNKFSQAVYEDLKKCLLQNKTLDFFDIGGNDLKDGKDIELSEIITKKHLERIGITFKSTPDLLAYFKAQKEKAKKEEEALVTPVQTQSPAGDKPPVEAEPKEEKEPVPPQA